MPLTPLVGAKRENLGFWWGEQRCANRGTVGMPHPSRGAPVRGHAQLTGCGCGVREGAALEDWPPRRLGGRHPEAPSFSAGQVAELPAAMQGVLVLARPLHPTRRGGSRAGRVGRQGADPRLPARRQAPRLTPPPHRPGLAGPALVRSSEASPVPGDPHDVSLAGGAPPTSSLVKTPGWRGWARLGCLGRPTDGQTD